MTIVSIIVAIVVVIIAIKAFAFLLKNIATIAIGIAIIVGGFFIYQHYQYTIHSYTVGQATKTVAKIGSNLIK